MAGRVANPNSFTTMQAGAGQGAMTIGLKDVRQLSAAAAVKAERERDKAEAMREYRAERLALLANTARLRALRLAKEAAGSQAPTLIGRRGRARRPS